MHVKARLTLMTLATVAIVLVVSGTSFFSVTNLIEDQKWLAHSRQVIAEFHGLMFRVAAGTAAERGYLLTGQISYLEEYRSQVKMIQGTVKSLRDLVQDNKNQISALAELSGVLEERVKSFDETINVYQTAGAEAAYQRVRNGQGPQFLQKMRALEKAFGDEEARLLDRRSDEMQRSVRATQLSLLAGALLSIAFVTVFNFFFGRHIVTCINTLLNASENAEQGRYNAVQLDAEDEFGELSEAFNQIGLGLENANRQLQSLKLENNQLQETHGKQQQTIQELHGLIDELAIEFQTYYASLDSSRQELDRALDCLADVVTANEQLSTVSSDLEQPINLANQKSSAISRTTNEVRRLLNTTAENLSSLKQSIEDCSEQADKLAGLQSELDNISNALEVISMSVDMTGPSGQPVLGAVMTRLHELSERCHEQRRTVTESISRMQTLLSRGMLAAHASSGAETTGRQLLDGVFESIETLASNLDACRAVSNTVAARVTSQGQLLEDCREALSDLSVNRRKQMEVIERLQDSVGQTADELIRT